MKTAFLKRKKFWISLIIILTLIVGGFLIFRGSPKEVKIAQAKVGNLEQIVSITGRINQSGSVDLALQKSGRVVWLNAKVGNKVFPGQVLLSLDNSQLQAQKLSAQANLDSAQTKLNQLLAGARTEDVNLLQAQLDAAQNNLRTVRDQNSVGTARTALNSLVEAMSTYTDMQNEYFMGASTESFAIADAKSDILKNVFNKDNLGREATWSFISLTSGMPGTIASLEKEPNAAQIKELLNNLKTVLGKIQSAFDLMNSNLIPGITPNVSDADRTKISNAKNSILAQIGLLNTQLQAISSAEGTVSSAQKQLDLKKAPPTQFDVEFAQSQVKQAEAGLASVNAQLADGVLVSPIAGTIASVDIEKGEISTPGKSAISVLSNAKYEIDANISEADIAKVKMGDKAKVTVDAYGQDASWEAQVVTIYPAETMIEGVANYKTVLQFTQDDERIKPGMTANLDILTASKENVLSVPQRSIYTKDGHKFVKVLVQADEAKDGRFANMIIVTKDKKNVTIEVPVETGLRGSDGRIEIISGLNEGDAVLQ